jgi:hypothetical protein
MLLLPPSGPLYRHCGALGMVRALDEQLEGMPKINSDCSDNFAESVTYRSNFTYKERRIRLCDLDVPALSCWCGDKRARCSIAARFAMKTSESKLARRIMVG